MSTRVGDSTLALDEAEPASSAACVPYLFVVLECHRPLAGAARYDLRAVSEVLIGRGERRGHERELAARRLWLRVPDAAMSSQHAKLLRTDCGWQLQDLGSTNGTRVQQDRVERAMLCDGDVIECGATFLMLRTGLADAAPGDLECSAAQGSDEAWTTLVPAYAGALAKLRALVTSDVPVLLRGETGTGKERLAAAVHRASGRRGELVAVNCGALPETLVESQLFGHARGAFSGAVRDEPGFVRSAREGTLFLDEIGDMPQSAQAALLRVLQEREVIPVGSTRREKVDFRVMAATHRDVQAAEQGFRADLYARLAGFTHTLPALRERREDLGILVSSILRELAGAVTMKAEVGRALLRYDWPLNVRELQQALRVACIVAAGEPLALRHFSGLGQTSCDAVSQDSPATPRDAVHQALLAALAQHSGNVSEVARVLGKTRMQIHRWLRRYAIDASQYR